MTLKHKNLTVSKNLPKNVDVLDNFSGGRSISANYFEDITIGATNTLATSTDVVTAEDLYSALSALGTSINAHFNTIETDFGKINDDLVTLNTGLSNLVAGLSTAFGCFDTFVNNLSSTAGLSNFAGNITFNP